MLDIIVVNHHLYLNIQVQGISLTYLSHSILLSSYVSNFHLHYKILISFYAEENI